MNIKKLLYFALVVVFVFGAVSCAPTTPAETAAPVEPAAPAEQAAPSASGAPEVCATDAKGCAKIEPGQTVKIGMGAPMTGGDASFGIDISQGAKISVQDAGEFEGCESDPDVGIRNNWWNDKWIPITYDGAGKHDCLDLAPGCLLKVSWSV